MVGAGVVMPLEGIYLVIIVSLDLTHNKQSTIVNLGREKNNQLTAQHPTFPPPNHYTQN